MGTGGSDTIKALEKKVDTALKNANDIEEIVDTLLKTQEIIQENIAAIDKQMEAPLDRGTLEMLFSRAFGDVDIMEYYTNILLREMNHAISQTKEYDLPVFRKRLTEAIRAPGTIQVSVTSESKVKVSILPGLRKNAGTLQEWLEAVKATRKELQIRHKSKGPGGATGSDMYEEKIYKPAREGGTVARDYGRYTRDITEKYNKSYFETLRMRLNHVTSLAPWWEYLEYGTDHGPATAGGRAYPHYAGTHFVAKATIKIIENIKSRIYFTKRRRDKDLLLDRKEYSRLVEKIRESLYKVKDTKMFTEEKAVARAIPSANNAINIWFNIIRTNRYTKRKLSPKAQAVANSRLVDIFKESAKLGALTTRRMRGAVEGEDISTRTVEIWNDQIVPNLRAMGIPAKRA